MNASDAARRIAAPLLGAVVAVPGTDLGSCAICHSSKGAEWIRCFQCNEGQKMLGHVPTVLPITMSIERSQMHHALRDYKDGWDASVCERFTYQIAGLLELFSAGHQHGIGAWDVVTCVPSRKERTAFRSVIMKLGRYKDDYEELLTVASDEPSHKLSPHRFTASTAAAGRRVLILEDTFTSGASVFSATAALRAAGGIVNTILVVGRHVNPQYSHSAELLDRAKSLVWQESECVLCRPSTVLF